MGLEEHGPHAGLAVVHDAQTGHGRECVGDRDGTDEGTERVAAHGGCENYGPEILKGVEPEDVDASLLGLQPTNDHLEDRVARQARGQNRKAHAGFEFDGTVTVV